MLKSYDDFKEFQDFNGVIIMLAINYGPLEGSRYFGVNHMQGSTVRGPDPSSTMIISEPTT